MEQRHFEWLKLRYAAYFIRNVFETSWLYEEEKEEKERRGEEKEYKEVEKKEERRRKIRWKRRGEEKDDNEVEKKEEQQEDGCVELKGSALSVGILCENET